MCKVPIPINLLTNFNSMGNKICTKSPIFQPKMYNTFATIVHISISIKNDDVLFPIAERENMQPNLLCLREQQIQMVRDRNEHSILTCKKNQSKQISSNNCNLNLIVCIDRIYIMYTMICHRHYAV